MSELTSNVDFTPPAERTPLPGMPIRDERLVGAWCEWLGALATDAEAALATAIAYRELTPAGRDYWLAVLEQDEERLDVPKIAVYAPLLAVESDPVRRERTEPLAPRTDEALVLDRHSRERGPLRGWSEVGVRGRLRHGGATLKQRVVSCNAQRTLS